MGVTHTKMGLTFTIKTLRKYTVGFPWCCGGVVTDCKQTSNKMTLNDNTLRWKGSKGLWSVLPITTTLASVPLCDISTTDLLLLHVRQLHGSSSNPQFDNFAGHWGFCQLYTYNNRQQHSWKLWHTCVDSFQQVRRTRSSFSFISPSTDMILLTVTVRYSTPCVLLQPKLSTLAVLEQAKFCDKVLWHKLYSLLSSRQITMTDIIAMVIIPRYGENK